ncbi:unnamed protein product [Cylicostephanus goldi]|uniref:Uncharacterized protein n=1 Tax=Cylicostephanus goldi TaxID=71465 RepID=A0A3P6TH98_CYLGO|nr:unnamed protein product [Cylicostephanus goldi]
MCESFLLYLSFARKREARSSSETSEAMFITYECWWYWKKYGGLKERHQHEIFDVIASINEDAASDVHENAKPASSVPNPPAAGKSSSAAQQNRPIGTGHVIARLPPNHPLLLAATSGSTLSVGNPVKGKVRQRDRLDMN